MDFEKVKAVYFTGTGTTKKVVETIAGKICSEFERTDFSLPEGRKNPLVFDEKDLVIFGVPVYAGRVPNVLLGFLEKIEGNGAIAVPVVTFGNRAFDDALTELSDILQRRGMHTAAAAAFSCQHSFSDVLAAGRPDEKDIGEAEEFAGDVVKKIRYLKEMPEENVALSGNPYPYRKYYVPKDHLKKPINILGAKPETKDSCIHCGKCIRICRMGSIDPSDCTKVTGICIKCNACVRGCPAGAKYFSDTGYIYHRHELEQMYKRRAENSFFL